MLANSNSRFILQGIKKSTTFESLRKLIFKYYGVDYDNVKLELCKNGTSSCFRIHDRDKLQDHQFMPYRDYLTMHWMHEFWDTHIIYGINLYRICLCESVNYHNIDDTNYQKCKYGIKPLRLNRAAIDNAINIDIVETNGDSEVKKLHEVKALRCFVPKQILDPHADGHRMNINDNKLSDPLHNISYFTMFNHVNPNAMFDLWGTNKLHIKNRINTEDDHDNYKKEFESDYKDKDDNGNVNVHGNVGWSINSNHGHGIKITDDSSKSICVYSKRLIGLDDDSNEFLGKLRQCTHVEFKVKLLNPKGVTIGLTTGSQILKKNNKGKMQYRNDIYSNNEIYAINCQTCCLFSHRKWTNCLFDEKLKFEMNDTITIRLNMVHNHIAIYKNNDWVGIAYEDVIMDCKDCRLVICMESNDSNVVVTDYYPTQSDIMKIESPVKLQCICCWSVYSIDRVCN